MCDFIGSTCFSTSMSSVLGLSAQSCPHCIADCSELRFDKVATVTPLGHSEKEANGHAFSYLPDMALKIEETVDLFRPTGGTSDIEIEHNLNIFNCQDNAPYTESTFVADNDTGSDRNKMAKFELRDLVHTGVARLEIEIVVPRAREIVRYKRYNLATQIGTIGTCVH